MAFEELAGTATADVLSCNMEGVPTDESNLVIKVRGAEGLQIVPSSAAVGWGGHACAAAWKVRPVMGASRSSGKCKSRDRAWSSYERMLWGAAACHVLHVRDMVHGFQCKLILTTPLFQTPLPLSPLSAPLPLSLSPRRSTYSAARRGARSGSRWICRSVCRMAQVGSALFCGGLSSHSSHACAG